jgi:hypothetical protein
MPFLIYTNAVTVLLLLLERGETESCSTLASNGPNVLVPLDQ